MSKLTLIVPAKEEASCLPKVLDEIFELKLDCKIKVCLEKSDYLTIESIKNYPVEIYVQKNAGYGSAIIEGINNTETDYFCIFNADGSFNPKEIGPMIKKINEDKLDILFASRYLEKSGSEDDTFLTLIGNYIFSAIGKYFLNIKISDILYTFVIGNTSKIKKLNLKDKDFRLCVELPIKSFRNKLNIGEIPSYERPRISGEKKVSEYKDGFLILCRMIKFFFSANGK